MSLEARIEAKAAFSAPGNLSTHDDHDDVDCAPADGDGALLWNAAADLVVDRGGGTPKILPTIRIMDRLDRRKVNSALLHLGADFIICWAACAISCGISDRDLIRPPPT